MQKMHALFRVGRPLCARAVSRRPLHVLQSRPPVAHSSFCGCEFCTFITSPVETQAPAAPAAGGADEVSPDLSFSDVEQAAINNLQIEQQIQRLEKRASIYTNYKIDYSTPSKPISRIPSSDVSKDASVNHMLTAQQLKEKNDELLAEIQTLRQQLVDTNPHEIRSPLLKEDPDIALLLANNRKWTARQLEKDPIYFERVGGPQKPKYLYIGCSDSRVPANQILGLGPGEVFVHRNVGNQVIGSDLNMLSGLEFAVNVLDVKHIIVTGHYDCGAILAASRFGQDLGLLEHWLRSLRDIYRNHHQVLDSISDEQKRHHKFVELCVVEQCLNLYKTGVVQRRRKETHLSGIKAYPRIHAMVFDPKKGVLEKLPIDFKKSVGKFRHIYDLY